MLIIKNIKELATSTGEILTNAMIFANKGKIIFVGKTMNVLPHKEDEIIDASEMIALPGFVDCHTHIVFGGSRANEYDAKLQGMSYSEVQKRGGGIHYTVNETRKTNENELYANAKMRLQEMLRCGTTTVEIKSGYGLSLEDEIKILRAVRRSQESEPQDIVATFLGAHTVPKEFKNAREVYVDLIVKEMLPRIAKEKLAECCDVFCDPLGFTVEETEKIFTEAKRLGFKLHIHGEQTAHFGGAKTAGKFNAISLDHGDYLDEEDISLLKKSDTIVVLLPGVLMHCMEWNKIDYPKLVQKLKTAGVPIAFATDYNPGSAPILSMKLVMDLGMRFFKMGVMECLQSSTIIPAKVLAREDLLGSIEVGKQADMLLIKAHSIADYLYQIGDRRFDYIIKKGKII